MDGMNSVLITETSLREPTLTTPQSTLHARRPSSAVTPAAPVQPGREFMGVEVGNEGRTPPKMKKVLILLFFTTIMWGLGVFLPSLQAAIETPTAMGNGTTLFTFILGYVASGIFYVAYKWSELKHITFKIHRFAFAAGFLQVVARSGYTLLIRSGGESSLLAPLAGGLYLVVPVFMGFIFLHEPRTPQKIIGIALSVGSILLLSITDTTSFNLTSGLTMLYFCMAFFGWGFDVFFMTLMGMTPFHGAVLAMHMCGMIVAGCIMIPVYGDLSLDPFTLGHWINVLSGLCSVVGALLYYALSFIQRDSSLVVPLSSLYILWPVLFGLVFLHDSVTGFKIAGIIVASFAVFLMSISDLKAFLRAVKGVVRRSPRVGATPEPKTRRVTVATAVGASDS